MAASCYYRFCIHHLQWILYLVCKHFYWWSRTKRNLIEWTACIDTKSLSIYLFLLSVLAIYISIYSYRNPWKNKVQKLHSSKQPLFVRHPVSTLPSVKSFAAFSFAYFHTSLRSPEGSECKVNHCAAQGHSDIDELWLWERSHLWPSSWLHWHQRHGFSTLCICTAHRHVLQHPSLLIWTQNQKIMWADLFSFWVWLQP